MLVHADEVLNELLRVSSEISQVWAHWDGFIEIFKVKSLVIRSTVAPVAVSRRLEIFFGDLDLAPESIQSFGHVWSTELHLVDKLA